MADRWHIGQNGPARCRAQEGNCPLGEVPHGSDREALETVWLQSLEEIYGDGLAGQNSRSQVAVFEDESLYEPTYKKAKYSDESKAVAKRLAAESGGRELGAEEDSEWKSEGLSVVRRYRLADGSVGYFKPALENGKIERYYTGHGSTSLSSPIAEVNAYRLAQLMGGEYSSLVPETSLEVIDGKLGSLQREVIHTTPEIIDEQEKINYAYYQEGLANAIEDSVHSYANANRYRVLKKWSELMEIRRNHRNEARRAALYDFVAGSLDRHASNLLMEGSGDSAKLKLIDNSFSFPPADGIKIINKSGFSNKYSTELLGNTRDRNLTDDERGALQNVHAGVGRWIEDGTIERERGEETLKRVDHLLSTGKIEDFTLYMSRRDRRLRQEARDAKSAADASA